MKKKNIIIIVIIVAVLLLVSSLIIYVSNNRVLYLESHEISDIEKSNVEIPKFTIVVKGLYDGTITNLDLKENNIQVYEFNAGVYNGWVVNTNHYTGVRLKDVFEAMDITEYSQVEFQAPGEVSVTYDKKEISNNTYLIFYRDGELIRSDEYVSLLAVDYDYRYSLENVITIILK